uniref:Reverse transcriptase domain-containing protein n=1 Tax=Tanacetum cinerariifolium TaxID=118510 RepID=A0A6L2M5Y9_TANCI|nr:hypothetical protein [Tanacetum cinerariifolium]
MDSLDSATYLKSLLREKPRMGYQIETSTYMNNSTILEATLPPKEKDPGSFTLPCYINNICFKNALADLGVSVSVMPYSTFDNLGLDMPEDIKVPLILKRPFLSTAHAKIDVFKRKIALKIGNDKIVFKSDKPTSNIIKRVYALGLRERMELDSEARLIGEALILNRSLDHSYGDYIELNDLNEPLELRRDQVEDLGLMIEVGEVIDKPMIKARQFDGMITIYNGNDSVIYQMARSHPMFKHLTNAQCNKIRPLLKVSAHDMLNGILHPYQKLKSFYKGVLDLGPEYLRYAKIEELLICGHNFQDIPDDEEDTRSSQEYMDDLKEEYQVRALLAKSKRKGNFARDSFFETLVPSYQSPFQNNSQPKFLSSSLHKPKMSLTKDFEAKYNKVKAKLALLKEVSSDDYEMVEVKVLMALANDNIDASKEGARNGEWVKISMRKHVNTKILKENHNLRKALKELIAIIEIWLNSSDKVNQCISEQIPTQKKRILGVGQLTEDPFSFRQKDLVFVKSSAYNTKVSIPCVERPWLSEAEGFLLPNHDIGRILPAESQVNIIDPPVAIIDSLATDYDSTDESSICSTPLPLLEKLGHFFKKRSQTKKSSVCHKKVKHVVAQFTPHLITMTLSGLEGVKHFKLRKLKLINQISVTSGSPSGTWTVDAQGI